MGKTTIRNGIHCLATLACVGAMASSAVADGPQANSVAPPWYTSTAPEATWGNVPDLAEAAPDSKGRGGRWWWPRLPQDDAEEPALGNRGRVFGAWEPPKPPTVTVFHPPLPPVSEPVPICAYPGHVIVNNILFDFDEATLKPVGKAEIDKLVREMQKYIKDTLVCIGHTDDAGSPEYNMALGEKRAMAVKNYMVESGIAEERIAIRSMGESQPAVPNDSRPNRARNRRVVFELTVEN